MSRSRTAASSKAERPVAPRRVSGPSRTPAGRAAPKGRGPATRAGQMTGAAAAQALAHAVPQTRPAPAAPRPRAVPSPPRKRPVAAARPVPFGRLRALPDHPLLDRLLRSRAWIVLLGIALGGIVAMQVSLLGMNAGISSNVVKASALQEDQGTLKEQILELSSGPRIARVAKKEGLITPDAGGNGWVRARGPIDARRAASSITPPSDAAKATLAGTPSTTTPAGQTTAPVAPATEAAPPPVATPAPTTAATAAPTAAPVTSTATPPPAATPAPVVTAAPTAAPVSTSGGATVPGQG